MQFLVRARCLLLFWCRLKLALLENDFSQARQLWISTWALIWRASEQQDQHLWDSALEIHTFRQVFLETLLLCKPLFTTGIYKQTCLGLRFFPWTRNIALVWSPVSSRRTEFKITFAILFTSCHSVRQIIIYWVYSCQLIQVWVSHLSSHI